MGDFQVAKENLLTYLQAGLAKLDFDGDLDLSWQKAERTFTLELTFYAQNLAGQEIIDASGVDSDQEIISFVDAILLYDEQKPAEFDTADYLACLPFAGKAGWTKQQAAGFLAYLQEVVDNGQADLLDFLNEESETIFELKFDEEQLAKWVAKQNLSGNLAYPKF